MIMSSSLSIPAFSFRRKIARAFTLIELLVTLGIVALLAAVITSVSQSSLKKAAMAREISAGKTLINAYLLSAADNDGNLMVAHYEGNSPEIDSQQTNLPDGTLLEGGALHRYPYRLAPYFDYKIDGVILVNGNKQQVPKAFSGNMLTYGTSLCPAFGINYYFLGGHKVDGAFSQTQLTDTAFKLAQVPKPSSMLVFATAFTPDVNGQRINGRFGIEPPAYRTTLWDENLHVDDRYQNKVLCVFLDGSVRSQSIAELRDMRLWSKNAQLNDDANYRVAVASSGGTGGGSGGRK